MKLSAHLMLLMFVCISFNACQTEELPPEILASINNEEEIVPDETPIETPTNLATCETIPTDWSLPIDCSLDLAGETIDLPANTILKGSGEIINGTLNFAGAGQIDGILMTSSLTMTGTVTLTSPIFEFEPSRWKNIVQGNITSEIAQLNNNNLENLFSYTKELGATTFKMYKFDAYFEVSKVTSTTTNQNFYRSKEAVNIPSDFELIMSNETILRVFPTEGTHASTLLAIRESTNVIVKGGILYGDRDLRQYSKENAEEGSHLLTVHASNNVVIDGVKFTMGSVGGLFIESLGFTFNPDYIPSNNIIAKNCTFDKIRMIAIALTDGYDITIEGNSFIDTAQPTANSDGGVVGYAMDIEPVRTRDPITNELVWYQKVHDVYIRGNLERGSRNGAFTIYVGDNIIIENNDLESNVGWSYARNCKVRNNTFNAPTDIENKTAILASGSGETVYNNEISGNIISGYDGGIVAYHGKMKIFDNIINEANTGISINDMTETEIYNNNITSSKSGSNGFKTLFTSANNISIYNNTVSVGSRALNFVELNQEVGDENNLITIDSNVFNSGITDFYSAKGVIYKNNESLERVQIENASNLELLTNTISTSDSHGIAIKAVNTNITITQNIITRPSNFDCINIANSTNTTEITQTSNSCN